MRITLAALGTLSAAAAFAVTGLAGTAASVDAAQYGQRPVLARPLHAQGVLVPRARWTQGVSGRLLYVGVYDNGLGHAVVQIYSIATHKQVGEISGLGFPISMKVDSAGNLYVVELTTNSPSVLIFPPGATSPSRTISEAGYEPNDVAIGPDGSIYVANFCQGDVVQCHADGFTVKYPPVGNPTFYDVVGAPAFLAVRSTNQLIILGDASAPVGDFPPPPQQLAVASDAKGYRILHLPGSKRALYPRLLIDRQDRLALLAGGSGKNSFVEAFKPPFRRPVATVPLPGIAFGFAFPADGTHVWAAQYATGSSTAVAQEVTYPGGQVVASFPVADAYGSNGYPLSITVSP
jgi:hypothetical protein